jgi:hypothetical protein
VDLARGKIHVQDFAHVSSGHDRVSFVWWLICCASKFCDTLGSERAKGKTEK